MSSSHQEFEQIKSVLKQTDTEKALTAREIVELLDENDEDIDSPHRVAAILANSHWEDEVEVIREQPYRYRIR